MLQELFSSTDKSNIDENINIAVTEQLWNNSDLISYRVYTHINTINNLLISMNICRGTVHDKIE